MPLYSTMSMYSNMKRNNQANQQEARNSHIAGLNKRTIEKIICTSENMEKRKELIRRYLSFAKNATNDELSRYNDIMENASKPKS